MSSRTAAGSSRLYEVQWRVPAGATTASALLPPDVTNWSELQIDNVPGPLTLESFNTNGTWSRRGPPVEVILPTGATVQSDGATGTVVTYSFVAESQTPPVAPQIMQFSAVVPQSFFAPVENVSATERLVLLRSLVQHVSSHVSGDVRSGVHPYVSAADQYVVSLLDDAQRRVGKKSIFGVSGASDSPVTWDALGPRDWVYSQAPARTVQYDPVTGHFALEFPVGHPVLGILYSALRVGLPAGPGFFDPQSVMFSVGADLEQRAVTSAGINRQLQVNDKLQLVREQGKAASLVLLPLYTLQYTGATSTRVRDGRVFPHAPSDVIDGLCADWMAGNRGFLARDTTDLARALVAAGVSQEHSERVLSASSQLAVYASVCAGMNGSLATLLSDNNARTVFVPRLADPLDIEQKWQLPAHTSEQKLAATRTVTTRRFSFAIDPADRELLNDVLGRLSDDEIGHSAAIAFARWFSYLFVPVYMQRLAMQLDVAATSHNAENAHLPELRLRFAVPLTRAVDVLGKLSKNGDTGEKKAIAVNSVDALLNLVLAYNVWRDAISVAAAAAPRPLAGYASYSYLQTREIESVVARLRGHQEGTSNEIVQPAALGVGSASVSAQQESPSAAFANTLQSITTGGQLENPGQLMQQVLAGNVRLT